MSFLNPFQAENLNQIQQNFVLKCLMTKTVNFPDIVGFGNLSNGQM